jgi:hypothetical protein
MRVTGSFEMLAPGHRSALSRVYFVQAGDGGPIKIGRARNPLARMRSLQVSNHEILAFLGQSPCLEEQKAHAVERALHNECAAFHIHGEWFRPCREIALTIDICCRQDSLRLLTGVVR